MKNLLLTNQKIYGKNPSVVPRLKYHDCIMDLAILNLNNNTTYTGVKNNVIDSMTKSDDLKWVYTLNRSFEMYRDINIGYHPYDKFKDATLYITFRIPKKDFKVEFCERKGKVDWMYEDCKFDTVKMPLKTVTIIGDDYQIRFSDKFIVPTNYCQLILEVNYESTKIDMDRCVMFEVVHLCNSDRQKLFSEIGDITDSEEYMTIFRNLLNE